MHDGQSVEGGGSTRGGRWRVEAVHTPGHTSNHLCFALTDPGILFSGDHVMGWSTSVIAPPDGDMAAYMASLDKLLGRPDRVYWPTHGPAITEPQRHVRAFIAHRREREAGILDCLKSGCETVDAMVERSGGIPYLMHHLANTLRDFEVDASGASRSLAQVIGRRNSRLLAAGLALAVGLGVGGALVIGGRASAASIALGVIGLAGVAQGAPSERRLWYGILVAAVCWTAAWALSTG